MTTETYLFVPEGKGLKQGFVLKDGSGNIVYEAKMTKMALLGAMTFEFTNHLIGKNETHKVGHTLTTETSDGVGDVFSTHSCFKMDGKNIWDLLHEQGIQIANRLAGGKIGMAYEVSLKGQPMATLTSTTPGGKSMLTSKYCYDITTEAENLDLAFLVAFAIARTDQAFYS